MTIYKIGGLYADFCRQGEIMKCAILLSSTQRFSSEALLKNLTEQNKLLRFVPKHRPVTSENVEALQNFLHNKRRLFVLTGAGVSTESGIPDYRSAEVGLFARSNHKPIEIRQFMLSESARRRYWARNYLAWPRFSSFEPNITHQTLRSWEVKERLSCLVTQNVDGLHKKAGSVNCIELHGSSHRVLCTNQQCDYTIKREDFQATLTELNPNLLTRATKTHQIRPDGDIELADDVVRNFVLPPCPSCGNVLKPDIVFFGDNVPRDRVDLIYDFLKSSDAVLVLGSTLHTFSAYRYILSATERNLPIAIVTLGATRADSCAHLKLSNRVGELLSLIEF